MHCAHASHACCCASSDIDTYFTERVVTRKTAKLIRHRDRYFTLAFVTGNAVGLGFWIMLYPHASYPNMWQNTRFYQTILEHGFTWLAIWVETLLVRHRYRNWCPEFSIVMAYGIGYLAWNFLCFDGEHSTPSAALNALC